MPVHVWVDETRPRNQGASLTAYELLGEGVPHTVVVDNVGGHLMQHGKVDLGAPHTAATGSALDAPTELTFVLDAAAHAHIAQAEADFDALVGAHDMAVLHYEGYGKEFIKKFKTSPDAWAQLVKQLAFHKMFGRPGVCYESAQTRKYQLGRTEVIRAASNESKAWAEAMLNPDTPVRPTEKNTRTSGWG